MTAHILIGQHYDFTVNRLGGQGDGIANKDGLAVYIPFALAGEKVQAVVTHITKTSARATLQRILEPSPHRQTPACVHFTHCGGCTLQHLSPDAYLDFKRMGIWQLVQRLGYSTDCIQPLITTGPASRRRVELRVNVTKGQVSLGFTEARSHTPVPLSMCPVMEPALFALVPILEAALSGLSRPGLIESVALTLADVGVDAIVTCRSALRPSDLAKLESLTNDHHVQRLSLRVDSETPDVLSENAEISMEFGGYKVGLPVGAFLQASRHAQQSITDMILRITRHHSRVVDLYSGCGTYSLPLMSHVREVSAYEGSEAMVVALQNTARQYGLEDRLRVMQRDLYRQPVSATELYRSTAIIINPPRNGALPQMQEIAQSTAEDVVVVSCNPASFERDAAPLKKAGFDLKELRPIDQFHWTSHLELVAHFSRIL